MQNTRIRSKFQSKSRPLCQRRTTVPQFSWHFRSPIAFIANMWTRCLSSSLSLSLSVCSRRGAQTAHDGWVCRQAKCTNTCMTCICLWCNKRGMMYIVQVKVLTSARARLPFALPSFCIFRRSHNIDLMFVLLFGDSFAHTLCAECRAIMRASRRVQLWYRFIASLAYFVKQRVSAK